MKNIIVAWCNTNEKDFEDFIPLQFVGKRNLKLDFSNDINVIFLSGYNLLSEEYRKSLSELGFHLHDVSNLFSKIRKNYSQLEQFTSYERNTLLKWVVVGEFLKGENIVHYDGDIVFNEDPAVIAKKVAGKTFILQGCPAFTVISNSDWLDQYKENFEIFAKNPAEYSKKAWQDRQGWKITFRTRWAGSSREVIKHDQDLLSYLIHKGKIIQDPIEDVLFSLDDYILFENPLFIHSYDENFPYNYTRENGIDYFSYIREDFQDLLYEKRVLFWHMQSCFNFYLSKFIFRKKFLKFIPLGRLDLHLSSCGFEDYINKKLSRFLKHTSRLSVYKYFFLDNDFSGILKDKVWWKKGIF